MWARTVLCLSLLLVGSVIPAQDSGWLGGHYGEGYSSSAPDMPIQVAHRMFTTTSNHCVDLPALPARLESASKEMVLRVGERFSLSTVTLRAIDQAGAFIPKMPFLVTLYYEPGVLDFTPPEQPPERLQFSGVRQGSAVVTFQAICVDRVQLRIPIRVVP